LASVLIVAATTLLQAAPTLLRDLALHHHFLLFYPAVAIAALYLGLASGILATVLSALSINYFLMPPFGHIFMRSAVDEISLAIFVLEGFVISYAAERLHRDYQLRQAMEGGRMGMWSWEIGSDRFKWNEQEYKLGLPKRRRLETIELFFKTVHPEDAPKIRSVLNEVLEKGNEFVQEFRIVRPDGEVRWVLAHARLLRSAKGKPTRLQGVNYDITSRKQAEEALIRCEAEARARANELAVLMDTVPAITVIAHDPQCRHMSGSHKTRQLLRIPEGKSISLTAPEDLRPDSYRTVKDGKELTPEENPVQLAARGKYVRNFEMTLLFNDGSSSEIFGDAVPLFDENGEVRGAVGAFLDITEYKAIQRELQHAHDELEQRVAERTAEVNEVLESLKIGALERIATLEALHERDLLLIHQSRLAAMGEILSNISHQWRQPLNVMGLIVQELPMMYGTVAFTEQYLNGQVDKAKELIFRMSQTIDEFKNFFKPGKEKLEFKAGEMIVRTLALVEDALSDQQIKIEVDKVGDPVIYGYFNECSQVILNMLLNSRDAFLEQEKEEARTIRVTAFGQAERTVITVADNAGGIPEEVIGKVFEPYFTTKGPDKGTGIGLFMAKNIIETHMNGRLTVRNIDGGVEFRIVVPSKPPGAR